MPSKTDIESALPAPAQRLVAIALELFHERGYDATGVQDIVNAAGVTKGAFYHYFSSKDDLLRLIHEQYIDEQLVVLEAIAGSDREPDDKLAAVIKAIVDSLPESQKSMSVFVRERRALSPKSMALLSGKRDRYESLLTGIILDGMAAGTFARTGNPKLVSFAIVGMCSWAHEWFDPTGSASTDEIGQLYASLVLDGLRASA